MTRRSSSPRTIWGGQLATRWGGQLAARLGGRPATRRFGRLAAVTITIFAIAGTLSGCGRYGSPVRVSPDRPVSPTESLDSEAIAPAADESSDHTDADHDMDRTDQTDQTE